MKKRIAICLVLFAFAVFSAAAEYYWGFGQAVADYRGTTKNTTIETLYNNAMRDFANDIRQSTPRLLSGKLSKNQSTLLWKALDQYNYTVGEIYFVLFTEANAPYRIYVLAVQIEPNRTCLWKGFTSDALY